MTRTIQVLPAFFILIFCIPAGAIAQSNESLGSRLALADSNGDGRTTREEWTLYRLSQFNRLDRNHDGFIAISDVPSYLQNSERAEKLRDTIRRLDTNDDAKLSQSEFGSDRNSGFDKADVNKDAIVDEQERKQVH